ncbi:MAG: M3 family metallopeptidase [Ignavibacteriales bacterium]|jgi:peptidyl-dipeptidase Dcp (EC 3.4.15.5). Metallo peptidase. MEROPS family M03A|nr:MAG: M3 family metallopeptidase [Ignavibacteriaceae bacterium]MBW7873931.1 M3 family metallopeptidase [Ignavibacteria bacterium]MCZ2143310.1 M3 family metallopeptidase [Ignavibacteriales bacterium]OQY75097.1 MAG: peptidase M3 [Ignavibacteriales bacterium UTCHB3]MBZ0198018.1 M3 family metallopeptidase [Ignavibacteriaceae bacterium]
MKNFVITILVLTVAITTLSAQNMENSGGNPFFQEWKTPFGTPPFSQIKLEHYIPAYEEGIKEQNQAIDKIVANRETPNFKNTIEALEVSGALIAKVYGVFTNLVATITNDEMQEIAEKVALMMARHQDDIYLNEGLFRKVKAVYDDQASENLNTEQKTLLKNYYLDFVRGGANLNEAQKKELRGINEELSKLNVQFGDNVRKENSKFRLVVDDRTDLEGLSEDMLSAAAEKAEAAGVRGKWLFTIDKPTLLPFLQFAKNRSLREKMYRAYMNRGNNNDELDNKKILARIVSLRVQKAKLLGYNTYADFVIEKKMAKTPENAYKLLYDVWKPTIKKAKSEVAEMQAIIDAEGGNFKLQPWDWWYYAEKVKKAKYDLDENMLRPYFKLDNVIKGVFRVATELFGLQFVPRPDIETYHPEVRVFEVREADGKHVGVLYTDYYPRDSKNSGAWCENFRLQTNIGGNFVAPLVANVGNFSRPTADKPSLISLDETLTLFHEFGHALHFLLPKVTYPGSSNVPADFVEFPSQMMEKWALQPEVLKLYATHYETGEVIPDSLIEKLERSGKFNQGFETGEYIAASILDLDYHTLTDAAEPDVPSFEAKSLAHMGIIPEFLPRYMSTNFLHIATWGYEAGYYSYLWSAVLDADAFEAFEERGIFDKKTASDYRKYILEPLGSVDLMENYKMFRGREPKVDALLRDRGLE